MVLFFMSFQTKGQNTKGDNLPFDLFETLPLITLVIRLEH